jgi:hypothetical protein
MTWICVWPAVGVGEETVEVDASELVESAASSERLWTEV